MRDTDRIDIICSQLAEEWKRVPDMRLGQLFNNFQRTIGNDCFYIEDNIFIEKIRLSINEWLQGR